MASNTSAKPFVVPTTGLWEGDDGAWSTFYLDLGTPPQRLRLHASIGDAALLLNVDDATHHECPNATSPDCYQLFNANMSSSWQATNSSFPFLQTDGSTGVGHGGFDTVDLGSSASSDTVLPSQPTVLYPLNAQRIGFIGISPIPHNFSFFATNVTFLTALKQSYIIPSLSWGLTVGAKYRENAMASLTLGGYDSSKFIATPNASFPLDSLRDNFQVFLQAITINNAANESLISQGISIVIDTTTPKFWLPIASSYPINESLHQKLQSENPSISFFLSPDPYTEATVNITLPYASFDLEVSPPTASSKRRYFPLGQVQQPGQSILGRAFLQEAYMIADYERSNFSIFQRSWNTSATPQLVSVEAVQPPPRPLPTTLSTSGNLAGITIGVISILILGIGLAFEFLRSTRASKTSSVEESAGRNKHANPWHINPEMDGAGRVHGEVEGTDALPAEADGTARVEIQGPEGGRQRLSARFLSELEGSKGRTELEATTGNVEEVDESSGDIRDG